MSLTRSVHVRIEGLVQGVGYRFWVEENCLELGLTGWVCNRRGGSVVAVFQGQPARVAEMLNRCKSGPRLAVVTSVEVIGEPAEHFESFQVRSSH